MAGSLLFLLLAVVSHIHTTATQHVSEELKPRIHSLHIQSDIKFRFATTLVTSHVVNPSDDAKEAVFDVILPNEAFISNFTLEIEGTIYPGAIKEKEQAKRDYDKARKRGQSAGHVSQRPRETNRFQVEVNVANHSSVVFNLTYQELLKRNKGIYEHTIYVNPGQPVRDMRIDVGIQESREITLLNVPPIRNDLLIDNDITDTSGDTNDLAIIKQPTSKSAYITYIPSLEDQGDGIDGQFVVEYDIDRELDAGDVLVVNGYFIHFFAPKGMEAIPKDVLFILDVSGSMSGTKLRQMQSAMLRILDDLREGDRFNIMKFSSGVSTWRQTMVPATQTSVENAKTYVNRLRANGGTNINGALLDGLDQLKVIDVVGERSPVVVFLTDGEATAGEQNNNRILENVLRKNEGEIPVFSLAFGADADYDLVKKVALQNNGVGRRIYKDSDADLQISGFYDEISVTLLNNVTFKYLDGSVNESSLTQSSFNNYFDGSEMVVAGRLSDLDANTVSLQVLANSIDGAFALQLTSDIDEFDFSEFSGLTKLSDFEEISEKVWAYLTIKQILKKLSIEPDAEIKAQLKEQALDLSIAHSFVTPLTSMVVTKPDSEEVSDDDGDGGTASGPKPAPQKSSSGRGGGGRRRGGGGGGGGGGYGGGGGGDPHYLVRIDGLTHPICFDVVSQQGEIYRLLQDPKHGIAVNAEIITSGILNYKKEKKTFIGKIAIKTKHHQVVVTPEAILFDTRTLQWTEESLKHFGQNLMLVKQQGHTLHVRFHFGAEVIIKRHLRHENDTQSVDFLNIYFDNEDYFSKKTDGLLGQFVNRKSAIFERKENLSPNGRKIMIHLKVKNRDYWSDESGEQRRYHRLRANLIDHKHVLDGSKTLCWKVHHEGQGLLYGNPKDYLVYDIQNNTLV